MDGKMVELKSKARRYTDEELQIIHEENRRKYFENLKLWRRLATKNGKANDT